MSSDLILNLADVYWQPQGREGIDAVIIMAAFLIITALGGGFWRAAIGVAGRRLGRRAPQR